MGHSTHRLILGESELNDHVKRNQRRNATADDLRMA